MVHGKAPNGLEMSRPASPRLVSRRNRHPAGRVGSIELLGRPTVSWRPGADFPLFQNDCQCEDYADNHDEDHEREVQLVLADAVPG